MPDYNKDLANFMSEYYTEEKEIIILTSPNTSGCSKAGVSTLWTASASLLAYVDANGKLENGEGRVVWPITEAEYKDKSNWYNKLCPETTYRLKVRELIDKTVPEGRLPSFYNRFMLVEILEKDPQITELTDVLTEYRRPIYLTDDTLGKFCLNKHLKFFEGKINWLGNNVRVYLDINMNDEATWQASLENIRHLFLQQKQLDADFRSFAANKLTVLANDWRESDETPKITQANFAKRISINSISIDYDGHYSMYYNDDDMFYGHSVTVAGDLANGPKSANIEG